MRWRNIRRAGWSGDFVTAAPYWFPLPVGRYPIIISQPSMSSHIFKTLSQVAIILISRLPCGPMAFYLSLSIWTPEHLFMILECICPPQHPSSILCFGWWAFSPPSLINATHFLHQTFSRAILLCLFAWAADIVPYPSVGMTMCMDIQHTSAFLPCGHFLLRGRTSVLCLTMISASFISYAPANSFILCGYCPIVDTVTLYHCHAIRACSCLHFIFRSRDTIQALHSTW